MAGRVRNEGRRDIVAMGWVYPQALAVAGGARLESVAMETAADHDNAVLRGKIVGSDVQQHAPEASAIGRAQRSEEVLLVRGGIGRGRHEESAAGQRPRRQGHPLEGRAPDDRAIAGAQRVDPAVGRAVVAGDGDVEQTAREQRGTLAAYSIEATRECDIPAHIDNDIGEYR